MLATSTSTVMTTQTPSPSQSSNSEHLTKSKSAVGAAVGGTIGGIALLALLAVCLIYFRRTSRQARSFEQAQATDNGSRFPMQSMLLVNERPLTSSEVGDGGGSSM